MFKSSVQEARLGSDANGNWVLLRNLSCSGDLPRTPLQFAVERQPALAAAPLRLPVANRIGGVQFRSRFLFFGVVIVLVRSSGGLPAGGNFCGSDWTRGCFIRGVPWPIAGDGRSVD